MDNVHVAVADPPADASLWQLSRLTRLSCAHALLPWHLRLPETLRRLDAAGARVVRGQRGDASTGPQSLDDEVRRGAPEIGSIRPWQFLISCQIISRPIIVHHLSPF